MGHSVLRAKAGIGWRRGLQRRKSLWPKAVPLMEDPTMGGWEGRRQCWEWWSPHSCWTTSCHKACRSLGEKGAPTDSCSSGILQTGPPHADNDGSWETPQPSFPKYNPDWQQSAAVISVWSRHAKCHRLLALVNHSIVCVIKLPLLTLFLPANSSSYLALFFCQSILIATWHYLVL